MLLVVVRYGLSLLSAIGAVLAVRGIYVTMRDLRALNNSGQNGPKRLSTLLRLKMEAFLLAVFVAMLLVGSVMLLATDAAFLQEPTDDIVRLVSRLGWNFVALLLVTMQLMSHKGRAHLDEYYDALHRRSTDTDRG